MVSIFVEEGSLHSTNSVDSVTSFVSLFYIYQAGNK